jgi:hypothetical protein
MTRTSCGRGCARSSTRSTSASAATTGPPESELPTSNQQAEATATAERLSAIVQFPAGTLRARAAGAAFAHGQDPGTDDDLDRYAPPDWPEVRASGWPGW